MNISKSFNAELYNSGKPQLLWTTINADVLTPVSVILKLKQLSNYHLLFESVEGGKLRGRYSIIALDPDLKWECKNKKAYIDKGEGFREDKFPPLESLRIFINNSRIDIPHELPPMAAGIFGYMGYDMVKLMERLPDKNPDTIGIPESVFIRPRIVIVFDSLKDQVTIITPIWNSNLGALEAYEAAKGRLVNILKNLEIQIPVTSVIEEHTKELEFTSHISQNSYHEIVKKAKNYIASGDVFQVVPSRRFEAEFNLPPFSLYRSLRQLNPSPYLFYLAFDGMFLVGSSPEILVKVKDGDVTIRPIAGTRKRGENNAEDEALSKDLLSDPKELAEHLMLLDLGRNDVGRVAEAGTVNVTEKMTIEYYSHVMHIVSNVEGKLAEGKDALDALIAGFPAGTVSGAPKIRAMEIIDELESEKRSFYAGAVGYFSGSGEMDSCIALRTALIKDKKIYIQAGGGVVADSDPEAEFQETENKAKAIIKAAEEAYKFI